MIAVTWSDAWMAGSRWRMQDSSWFVEVVTLSHTPDHHDG